MRRIFISHASPRNQDCGLKTHMCGKADNNLGLAGRITTGLSHKAQHICLGIVHKQGVSAQDSTQLPHIERVSFPQLFLLFQSVVVSFIPTVHRAYNNNHILNIYTL